MPKTTIYHNPRCGKSRQTLSLLHEKGIDPNIVEYLKTPPTANELDSILKKLNLTPEQVLRTKEPTFKTLNLKSGDSRSRKDWIKIMVQNPILIERPIVIHGVKAALGRPPENVLKIL